MYSAKYLNSTTKMTSRSRRVWSTRTTIKRRRPSPTWTMPCAHLSHSFLPRYTHWAFRAKKDLGVLSDLGHFLKGSSAALGLSRVKSSCEDIQHYGKLREGSTIITEAEAIIKITKSLACARKEYSEAKAWLDDFFASYISDDD
jgi:Hpt domain